VEEITGDGEVTGTATGEGEGTEGEARTTGRGGEGERDGRTVEADAQGVTFPHQRIE